MNTPKSSTPHSPTPGPIVIAAVVAGILVGVVVASAIFIPFICSRIPQCAPYREMFLRGIGYGLGIGFGAVVTASVISWFVGIIPQVQRGGRP